MILTDAIIHVESSDKNHPNGNDNAIGDKNLKNKAYGPMQIRQPVCDDVNRVFGLHLNAGNMLGNRPLSIDTFNKYMSIYATERHLGHEPTDEDRARCWNGGPMGPWKSATLAYWLKVEAFLNS